MRRKLTFLLLCVATIVTSKADESISSSKLWYDKPTDVWTEALPVGNGRIGAMIFGGVERKQNRGTKFYLVVGVATRR